MLVNELISEIRWNFFKRIDRKTGWGKKELKLEFEIAVNDVISSEFMLHNHPDIREETDGE